VLPVCRICFLQIACGKERKLDGPAKKVSRLWVHMCTFYLPASLSASGFQGEGRQGLLNHVSAPKISTTAKIANNQFLPFRNFELAAARKQRDRSSAIGSDMPKKPSPLTLNPNPKIIHRPNQSARRWLAINLLASFELPHQ